jgi:hypothetical protein
VAGWDLTGRYAAVTQTRGHRAFRRDPLAESGRQEVGSSTSRKSLATLGLDVSSFNLTW